MRLTTAVRHYYSCLFAVCLLQVRTVSQRCGIPIPPILLLLSGSLRHLHTEADVSVARCICVCAPYGAALECLKFRVSGNFFWIPASGGPSGCPGKGVFALWNACGYADEFLAHSHTHTRTIVTPIGAQLVGENGAKSHFCLCASNVNKFNLLLDFKVLRLGSGNAKVKGQPLRWKDITTNL